METMPSPKNIYRHNLPKFKYTNLTTIWTKRALLIKNKKDITGRCIESAMICEFSTINIQLGNFMSPGD